MLECNTIDLNGETLFGVPSEFEDGGGNQCGCDGAIEPCRVLSANLEPPSVDPAGD